MLPPIVAVCCAIGAITAWVLGLAGFPVIPWLVAAMALAGGWVVGQAVRVEGRRHASDSPSWVPGLVVVAVLALLLWSTWPAWLPPGGASDLTHHLMLVDVIERTRHLPDGVSDEAALGEMAHYTPGLHLLIVTAGALAGVDAYRTAYPLLALMVAAKAGLVYLIAHDVLARAPARVPLALSAVGLVLFAPRAYSLDGFLQAGFYAQVASELFVVAGWWALTRWWMTQAASSMLVVGIMGAAVYLVWPIWIGPLVLGVGVAIARVPNLAWRGRLRVGALALLPAAVCTMLHVSQHSAWLRLAGASGAVPAIVPGVLGWLLMALVAIAITVARPSVRVTLWFAGAIVLQAAALWMLAHVRGAETPYMAMKMIYLAVYPAAVLGTVGLGAILQRVPLPTSATAWAVTLVVCLAGLRSATATPLPPPIVDVDLDAAGRWARANLSPACVDYVVENAEQAYWLHLAVMGQPRSSPRTADIDGYTTNRAVGRWLEGSALPYAIARRELLPGEVLRDAEVVHSVGAAAVIRRPGVACPLPIAD